MGASRCFVLGEGRAQALGWRFGESRMLEVLGIRLPLKNCSGRLSDVALSNLRRTFEDAGVCSVDEAEYTPLAEAEWRLQVCADFGRPCEIRRTPAEWARDPKLKRLLRAVQALAEATCDPGTVH